MYRFALAALVCAAVLPSPSRAQSYPSKPIHFILPYVPGGIIDAAGRHLALRLSERLGQSVVPENRPGAGGMVGADVAARATPDGYTILLTAPRSSPIRRCKRTRPTTSKRCRPSRSSVPRRRSSWRR